MQDLLLRQSVSQSISQSQAATSKLLADSHSTVDIHVYSMYYVHVGRMYIHKVCLADLFDGKTFVLLRALNRH